ncbi:MAG: protein translocase subunit SecD [Acidimicrobiia bacterium]
MTVKRLRTYLVMSILVVVASLGGVLASGDEPVLGLDLQGGISIVYEAVGKAKPGALDVARDIIEERVNGLGVAEPEISRQGRTISVDLPGVKNRAEAAKIVGRTGELRFRPVLFELPPAGKSPSPSSTTTGATGTAAPMTTTTTVSPSDEAVKAAITSCDTDTVQALLQAGATIPTTKRADDKRTSCLVLRQDGEPLRLYLGPTELTGEVVDSAKSSFAPGQGYAVSMKLTGEGSTAWDQLGAKYFQQRVAIALDSVVRSAPAIQPDQTAFSSFGGTAEISGDFTQEESERLAKLINYGALPVRLEKLATNDVSPTLGRDQLDAGIAAGAIGLVLVALYMLVYYRLLGAVVLAGLLLSGAFVYALITFLGQTIGLALTLAGVTGLIVSIGITVDSYVVYFERLKDEVRTGKTVRSSVDRGFARSFRTILAADLVSLIGASALYFIAIGSVKGFAFFLGMSTLLDLAVAYFFMHPLVSLMARRPSLVRMRKVGIASGLDTPEATA